MAPGQLSITINGWNERLKVNNFHLQQSLDEHHRFELNISVPIDDCFELEQLGKILGEKITIEFHNTETNRAGKFIGIIDELRPLITSEYKGLRIKGFSPTIFMDCVPRFRCFNQKTLNYIIDRIARSYTGVQNLPFNRTQTGQQVPYSMQVQESDYDYLSRLAGELDNSLFYDGVSMQLRPLKSKWNDIQTLIYKEDVKHFSFNMNLTPLQSSYSGYQLENAMTKTTQTNFNLNGQNATFKTVYKKSECFSNQNIHLNYLIETDQEQRKVAEKILARQTRQMITLQCSSSNPSLKVGDYIKIENSNCELVENHAYLITAINHQMNSNNTYENSFTAIPAAALQKAYNQSQSKINCGPMIATVKDTKDPKNMGRVQVIFTGDEEQALSPWIRVLVPFTAHGGLFFTPEIGDQVVVFQEDFNIEKSAFVLGAFFTGKQKADRWKDPNQKKKGIATEKIQILFDDNTGKLTINAEEN